MSYTHEVLGSSPRRPTLLWTSETDNYKSRKSHNLAIAGSTPASATLNIGMWHVDIPSVRIGRFGGELTI